jgi:mannose-6-phosphate isomerase-like protein (cupin superfamily)
MQPKHFQPGEGKTFKIGRMSMTFKTTAGENWNAYTVCEAVEPPESGAGYHRHPTYDETFIICEGHYDFRLDGKLLKLGPGDVVFVPRGTAHGFVSTGPEVGRQIVISSPGGVFDAMIAEVTMLDTGSPTRQERTSHLGPNPAMTGRPAAAWQRFAVSGVPSFAFWRLSGAGPIT